MQRRVPSTAQAIVRCPVMQRLACVWAGGMEASVDAMADGLLRDSGANGKVLMKPPGQLLQRWNPMDRSRSRSCCSDAATRCKGPSVSGCPSESTSQRDRQRGTRRKERGWWRGAEPNGVEYVECTTERALNCREDEVPFKSLYLKEVQGSRRSRTCTVLRSVGSQVT